MKYIKYGLFIGVLAVPFITFGAFDSSLKYGMSGQSVSDLQELLVSENCLSVSPTGYFGLLTLNGVKCFQSKYGIQPVSGYFGVLSRGKANEIVANALVDSNKAEVAETGTTTPVAPCLNGAKYSYIDGSLCQPTNSQVIQEVQKVQTQISSDGNSGGSSGGGSNPPPAPTPTQIKAVAEIDPTNDSCNLGNNTFRIGFKVNSTSNIPKWGIWIDGDNWVDNLSQNNYVAYIPPSNGNHDWKITFHDNPEYSSSGTFNVDCPSADATSTPQ